MDSRTLDTWLCDERGNGSKRKDEDGHTKRDALVLFWIRVIWIYECLCLCLCAKTDRESKCVGGFAVTVTVSVTVTEFASVTVTASVNVSLSWDCDYMCLCLCLYTYSSVWVGHVWWLWLWLVCQCFVDLFCSGGSVSHADYRGLFLEWIGCLATCSGNLICDECHLNSPFCVSP